MFLSGADEMAEMGGKASDRHGGRQRHDESSAVGSSGFAPEASAHGLAEPLGGVEPDPRSAGGMRVTTGVGLEDPLPPLVGDAWTLSLSDQSIRMTESGGAYLTAFSTRCSTI